MGEESLALVPSGSGRAVEQAIVALKKGAHLLKYGRRGKPKFCPFRLSTDEKFLIWYSGQEERQLRLSSVTNVVRGQTTKQLQPERESQCLSLVYANGDCSLDLIFKDKEQAETWFLGLRAVTSRSYCNGLLSTLKKRRGAQSCINSPAGFMRRKQILGILEEKIRSSQVHSLSGSPSHTFAARCTSDGLSCSSDSFYSESSLSSTHNTMDFLSPSSPFLQQEGPNEQAICASTKMLSLFSTHPLESSESGNHSLRDVLIWGEGAGEGCLEGGGMEFDALLPKVLESTMMFDLRSISLGRKHAALVTKQGDVFCWGEGRRGRLGHKVDTDITWPKIVDSLIGVHVDSVACGEYQTCALTSSGELYTWGDNCSTDLADHNKRSLWLPHRLYGSLDGVTISHVACGEWHTAIVSTSGKVFTYGDGTFGVLGHGNLQSVSHPKEIESLKGLRVKTVACGSWHTAAIVEIMVDHIEFNNPGGKLFTWGDADKGRLGHFDQERKLLPTCIAELVDHDFVQVSCGRTLTVGLTSTGKVYTMGSAAHGQLGNPQSRDRSIVAVQGKLVDEFVTEISSGSYHIAALTSRGNVYTWGKGDHGQLGLGDIKDRNLPTLVEALRGRQVEHITCGSCSTAAICLHKSVSSTDQSSCKGCSMAFGFTRKKHNCYNCGLLFCRACSNKKSINASLAPNKNKPFRVCNRCFNQLSRALEPDGHFKFETNSPRPLFMSEKAYHDEKEAMCQMTSRNYSNEGSQCYERNNLSNPLSLVNGLPRWGQVSCPEVFKKSMVSQIYPSRHQLSSLSPVCLLEDSSQLISTTSSSMNVENNLLQSEKFLIEEIEKLKTQAENLQKLYRSRKEKIKENRQKTEEAWSLAKEEAAKSKAAKEVIQALTSRIRAMSEKFSAERVKDDQPISAVACVPREVEQPEDKNFESLSNSPIVFSNKLRSLRNGDSRDGILSVRESCAGRIDSGKTGVEPPKVEWVEQYQPGVYITFVTLPNGQPGLKRVRFSRKKFTDNEAKRWWDENQQIDDQILKFENLLSFEVYLLSENDVYDVCKLEFSPSLDVLSDLIIIRPNVLRRAEELAAFLSDVGGDGGCPAFVGAVTDAMVEAMVVVKRDGCPAERAEELAAFLSDVGGDGGCPTFVGAVTDAMVEAMVVVKRDGCPAEASKKAAAG
ncbi:Regulator of chromosome condensation (RCC1) family with FYVE zinc finger domain [Forsythia ovata]|uniref:Regulator of chromosome condensation (RCC1) family with FYVE zinc finger domain n=1 Tax=Forsythia ovata TaxID=205694 RepID=A0ABD1UAB7_9LAMI